jgi:CDP-glucose 4,6-dehydratase
VAEKQSTSDWKSLRVLVTGADGFVGGWLVRVLASAGAQVTGLCWSAQQGKPPFTSERKVEVISGDITDLRSMRDLVEESRVDVIYHLAASNINTGAGISPYQVFETNVRGVYTLLEAARIASRHPGIVVASSKEVEDCFSPNPGRKRHPYMTSKASAELLTQAYHDTFGVSAAIVRSDNLYGGGDMNWARLIPSTIRSVLSGDAPIIRSNGLYKRDYVYIEDAIDAYMRIGARIQDPEVRGHLFRLAAGSPHTVLDTVETIIKLSGNQGMRPQVLNEKSDERVDTIYVPKRERASLGWQPRTGFEAGLSATVSWYKKYFSKTGDVAGKTSSKTKREVLN